MKTKHTPTPWHVAFNDGGPENQPAFPSIRDGSGGKDGNDIVAMPLGDSETVKANAEFIVRAVNSHYELLEALRFLLDNAEPGEDARHSVKGYNNLLTVKELIGKLLNMPQDALVITEGCDCYGDAVDVITCRDKVLITREKQIVKVKLPIVPLDNL